MQMEKTIQAAAAAAFIVTGAAAQAQQYPSKPVQLAIQFGPGPADMIARITATCMGTRLKQPVVVVNKPGANGFIGASYIKAAPPDGYTLGFAASTMVADLAMGENPSFDVRRDLEPVTKALYGVQGIFINSELPVQSLADFINYAKNNPGKINYGSVGIGSVNHLATEALAMTTGTNMVHVPYPKGTAAFLTAIMGGELQMGMTDVNSPQGMMDTGKLKLIAILANQRLPSRPTTPLITETVPGMSTYVGNLWYGFFAPVKTPRDIIERNYTEIRQCLMSDEDVRAQFRKAGYESTQLIANRPEEFKAGIAEDVKRITDLVQRAGLKK